MHRFPGLLAGWAMLRVPANAQSTYQYFRSVYEGSTQPAIAVGNPTGDFLLSGFDTVNLFNGRLSVGPLGAVRLR
jgi:hypothetical protein